ncbi:DUF3301 domain-containing protein [Aestuariicella sp. G3-2]|uniref:DUF3301 domain-containing protein n=1 Tax=Pseudomaricurvus albidus TaxID=2842452 RepID=UPI001C0C4605|nr:DUF3301 domain-containing protein [Aestuariicella albida]MBU3069300.1 DUF3301 domain-containing protein [Aestuariicella albida]
MTIYDLMIAFAVGLIGLLIWQNAGFRDRAIGLAKQHCEHMDVQLLDDTVSLLSLRPKRDKRGNFSIARRYEFEFTATGDYRYRGEMTLMGKRLYDVELEPHRI